MPIEVSHTTAVLPMNLIATTALAET